MPAGGQAVASGQLIFERAKGHHVVHLGVDIITLTALQDSTDARFVPRIQGIRGLVRIQIDIMEAIA